MYKKGTILSRNRLYCYVLLHERDSRKGTCIFTGLSLSTTNENLDEPTLNQMKIGIEVV